MTNLVYFSVVVRSGITRVELVPVTAVDVAVSSKRRVTKPDYEPELTGSDPRFNNEAQQPRMRMLDDEEPSLFERALELEAFVDVDK